MSEITYRQAVLEDVSDLARIRAASWGTESYWRDRITAYMKSELDPHQALPLRVVYLAEVPMQGPTVGVVAGHVTRRFDCEGELEWLDVLGPKISSRIGWCGKTSACC